MIDRAFKWFFALIVATTSSAGTSAPDRPSNDDVERTIRSLLVASPYRISAHALAGTIRYRIALDGGATWTFPETAEQHVEQVGEEIRLTLCNDCGREAPASNEDLQRYLRPNAWVQSTDPTVAAFARTVVGTSVDARMRALVLAVQGHMTGAIDFREYQTAVEALASRGGDCTEFAVLLAAAARAHGIPTRVVVGLCYASHFLGQNHAFSPHMWVQAWDGGRWATYDAALGHFDAGHIAVAIGDGSPDSLGGAMDTIARLRILDAAGIAAPTG